MSLARLIRKQLPAAWQPPIRYFYERTRGLLERELPIVASVVDRGDHVADVGANNGLYTHAFAKRGAVVEAFEPQPQCVAVLSAYALRQRIAAVHVHPVALSATHGMATLHVPRGADPSPSASLHAGDEDFAPLDVTTERLDAFEFSDLTLVKIDVEGAELEVLAGAAETLRRSRPLLFVEIEQRHHREPIREVFEQIASYGYQGAFLDGAGRMRSLSAFHVERDQLEPVREPADGLVYVNNFFFSPSGGTSVGARRWPT